MKTLTQVKDFIKNQKTVRKYKKDLPNKELIIECIKAAQRAPSTSNHQPYSIIELSDHELRKSLIENMVCQSYVQDAPLLFLICIDWNRQDKLADYLGTKNKINKLSKFTIGIADASIFAQNLTLALQSYGLGVSYIASPYTAMLKVAELLDLPTHSVMPLHLISVGYPDETASEKPRYPLDLIYHEDKYQDPAIEKIIAYFESGSKEIEKDNYLDITNDMISTWREHYLIKFGDLAKNRTWDKLEKDFNHFFNQED